ncbi:MAG: cation diffusion facilitator family transporter [Snowella sp.]|nr:cation diffusion facilitator family transporter [Snowella sp.]
MSATSARPYTILSIGAAIATIGLKIGSYFLTDSVGLLSDALESGVNLLAACVAFWALSWAAKPADAEHPFGHSKAEYFSSGLESAFILIAAISIAIAAWGRLLNPQPLAQIEWGLALALVATTINGIVAWILLKAGRRLRSITLRADAHHLFTDVWTSVGVVFGILLVKLTGWLILDPLIALLVAANIIWTGINLLRETLSGLMDHSLPPEELATICALFVPYENQGICFHSLKTRLSGTQRFIVFHVLVPGEWTVNQGHDLCETLEQAIAQILTDVHVTTHLEPLEDPRAWNDDAGL